MILKNLKSLLIVGLVAIGLISCKKADNAEPVTTPQLLKINSWNPATGTESTNLEFTYDAKGTLTNVINSGTNFSASYNTNNKVSLLSAVIKGGVTVTYALDYNGSGQLTKITYTSIVGTSDNSYVKTYAYNAAGKVSKMTTVYANSTVTPTVIDYTWNGDNIATASNGTAYTTTYVTYDDKINPLSLGESVVAAYYGGPASKNNATEIKTLNGALINTQKRGYEYNAAGYATSMKLLDTSNEGQKYYYSN